MSARPVAGQVLPRSRRLPDPEPVLADCVAPLVRDLRERGLVGGYFFNHHGVRREHVLLRLRPTTLGDTDEVCRAAEAAVSRFRGRWPGGGDVELAYTEDERSWMFPNGTPPAHPDAGLRYRPYEPDHDRYGGPAGVALAEWHFEHSSDLVLELVHSGDVHVRSTMLGLSAQLTMIMAATFLPDQRRIADHLGALAGEAGTPAHQARYQEVSRTLVRCFAAIRTAVDTGDPDRLAGFRREWAWHCLDLRDRVDRLARAGELLFPASQDQHGVRARLLTPYLHETDNRLGLTTADEEYLAYLLARVAAES